jgi:hypothetical protein
MHEQAPDAVRLGEGDSASARKELGRVLDLPPDERRGSSSQATAISTSSSEPSASGS